MNGRQYPTITLIAAGCLVLAGSAFAAAGPGAASRDTARQVAPLFSTPVSYSLGGPDPRSLVAGDFDGDGYADLAATLFRDTEDDALGVLFGDGSGGFPDQTAFIAGYRVYGLAAGDFDGDGLADLAVTEGTQIKPAPRAPCGGPISVSVFLSAPSPPGSFVWRTCLTPGTFPIGACTADFDGDGYLDLAVANNVSNDVTLYSGAGDGTFPIRTTTGRWFTGPTSIATADLDGDGHPDLVVGHTDGVFQRGATVLLGNGDGTFRLGQAVFTGSGVRALRLSDLDGDGRSDLLAVGSAGGKVWVCRGLADGTFEPGQGFSAGASPWDAAAGDLDNDGIADIAVADHDGGALVLFADGSGGYSTPASLPTAPQPQAILVSDFNRDGRSDIAVAARNLGEQGSVAIFLQQPISILLPGDCNGDGATSIAEVQRVISAYLGTQTLNCGVDCDGDGLISIGEVQKAIGTFLGLPVQC